MTKTVNFATLRDKLYKKAKNEELSLADRKGWQDLAELLDQINKEYKVDSFAINTVESNSTEEN